MQIEVDAAQGPSAIGLTEDDGYLAIQGNAMTKLRTASLIGLNGFVEQRNQGGLKIFGGLVETYDVLVVRLHRIRHFSPERIYGHSPIIEPCPREDKPKLADMPLFQRGSLFAREFLARAGVEEVVIHGLHANDGSHAEDIVRV